MRLQKVEISKYKRFRQPQILHVGGKLTAVVGPNEAGKTSLLRALAHISNEQAFQTSGDGTEASRGTDVADSDVLVEALFAVERSDLESLEGVKGAAEIRWLYLGRRANGRLTSRVDPSPSRDVAPRQRVQKEVHRLQGSRWLLDLDEDTADATFESMEQAIPVLGSTKPSLDAGELGALKELATDLKDAGLSDEGPKYGQKLVEDLGALIASEESLHPARRAATQLAKRAPAFLLFQERDRNLRSSYSINEVADQPPPALANLCQLAELDLGALSQARENDDHGMITTLIEAANRKLRAAVTDAWSQSSVAVRLWLDGETLRVQVQTEDHGFWNIADRSDGLRSFVALTSFIAVSERDKPVILIDEAEAHLHYDAQADLIQMLYRQTLAPQVIYTTHSAGCLPEDLSAVRTIQPDAAAEESEIRNWFWEGQEPGLGPLLMGMGAATLAFVPTRYAVVTEGPSDVVLLPSILREATERDSVGFQVAPGLSGARPAEIGPLDLQAIRMVHLLDNDAGGAQIIKEKLRPAGIPDTRIVRISTRRGWVLEDMLKRETYVKAINSELGFSEADGISSGDLSSPGVPKSVEKWCETRGASAPSKRAVAQALVRRHVVFGEALLSDVGLKEARTLWERLTLALKSEASR